MRRALLLSGLLVLAFGLGCLNYTTGGKSEFHRAWAREHGLPADYVKALERVPTRADPPEKPAR